MIRIGIGMLVILTLIFVALLGIANEIRFQGCTARQDRAKIEAILAKRKRVTFSRCSRIPFKY